MRNQYYDFLKKHNISDVLVRVEIPYSTKIKYLTTLIELYDSSIINRALDMYKKNYIDCDRINGLLLYNQINYFCKKISKEK